MNKKLIMVLFSLFILLFAVGSISAASDNHTDTLNLTDNSSDSGADSLSTSDNKELDSLNYNYNDKDKLGDTYISNGSQLDDFMPGGNTILTNDIKMNNSINVVGTDFTLDGKGHTINCNGYMFLVYTGGGISGTAVLKNIHFTNLGSVGKFYDDWVGEQHEYKTTTDWGYCLDLEGGNWLIENCTFSNIKFSSAGTRLINIGNDAPSSVTIRNCKFYGINANKKNIIYNTISNCTIYNNYFVINNNTSTYIDSTVAIDANNNWWGNTANNYNTNLSKVGSKVSVNNWYYLNITSDKDNITLGDSAAVNFTVCNLYNATTKTTYFNPNNLTVNANISSGHSGLFPSDKQYMPNIMIDEGCYTTVYTPNSTVDGGVTIACYGVKYSKVFNHKNRPGIKIDVNDIIVDEDELITVTTNSTATGTFNITVGNFKFSDVAVSNGMATQRVKGLSVGKYDVFVVYNGDDGQGEFGIANATSSFTVNKKTATMKVELANITVFDDEIINVTLPEDATGTVYIFLDRRTYQASINNSVASIKFSDLSAGQHTVYIKYGGNDKYLESEIDTYYFTVNKVKTTIKIDLNNIHYLEDADITVYLRDANNLGLNENVTVSVNNQDYHIEIVNGAGKLTVPNLNAGTYTVNAVFNENKYYAGSTYTTSLIVDKATIRDIIISNLTYGADSISIKVLPEDTNGDISFVIDGNTYTGNVINGVAAIPADLNAGNYTVMINYINDKNYNDANGELNFTVFKASSSLTVTSDDVTYPNNAVVYVNVLGLDNAGLSGNVTVSVNGKDYNVDLADGKGSVTVEGLNAGEYTVTARYNGNNNYNTSTNATGFKVNKADVTDISIDNIVYGADAITVNVLPADANGDVSFVIGGTTYNGKVVNGVAVIPVDLNAGDYTVAVSYSNDKNYNNFNKEVGFTVSKASSSLTVNSDDVTYPNNAVVYVNVLGLDNAGLSGNVTVSVNGKDYNVDLADGKGSVTVEGLNAGEYTVTARYNGNNNYNICTNATGFKVNKADISSITINNGAFGDENITVNVLPADANGDVSFVIGGTTYNGKVVNGVAVIPVDLNAGDYTVAVSYSNDKNYNNFNKEVGFTVSKASSSLTVNSDDVTYPNNAVVYVNVLGLDNAGLSGNVTVSVNGKDYNVDLADGKGSVTVEGLNAGEYTVTARYNGNSNYNICTNATGFKVSKADISSITINNGAFGDENITVNVLPADANGDVSFVINGTTYNGKVVNGVAVIPVDLNAGDYTVAVSYSNDKNYNNFNKEVGFTVSKASSSLTVNSDDVTYPNNAVVYVNVLGLDNAGLSGNVTVSVNGKDYNVDLADGKGSVTVEGLNAGEYTVTAKYNGNNNYNTSTNTTGFKVNKADISSITINNGAFGDENITVNVLPAEANGDVSFVINGTTYNGKVENGVAVVPANLDGGNYSVNVSYFNDKNYNDLNKEVKFLISNKASKLTITADNVNYPENVSIIFKLTDKEGNNLDGNITVTVNGKDYTVDIKNGMGSKIISGLDAGNYIVNGTYAGNDNYGKSDANTNFTVNKADVTGISIDNIVYGADGITVGVLPADANGDVSFVIGGTTYNGKVVNGAAVIPVDLNAGDYTVAVSYSNDKNYNNFNKEVGFTVSKAASSLTVNTGDIIYNNNAVVYVNVLGLDNAGLSGNVTVSVNGKDYNVDLADGKGSLTVEGLNAGEYTVTAKYNGNNNYNTSTNTTSFKVNKADITSIVIENSTYGADSLTVGVLPADADGDVSFVIGGTTYNGKVENGVAVIPANLNGGDYSVNVSYSGNNNYAPATLNTNFTVSRIPSSVNISFANITDHSAVVIINVTKGSTGTVVITFNNAVNFTRTIDEDGNAFLTQRLIYPGNHTYKAYYDGDENYYPSESDLALLVINKRPSVTTINVNITGNNGTFTFKVSENATGNITVALDNVNYTVNITNSTGILKLDGISAGIHNITANYNGDRFYLPSNNSTLFSINKTPENNTINNNTNVNNTNNSSTNNTNGLVNNGVSNNVNSLDTEENNNDNIVSPVNTPETGNPLFVLILALIVLVFAPFKNRK